MSTTGNEFEHPGVNHPDREDADGANDTPSQGEPTRDEPDAAPSSDEPSHQAVGIGVVGGDLVDPQAAGGHRGQDGGRDTLTAGQAQREGALGTEQEQRLPAMAQNNANDLEKVAGIVAQTRGDLAATEPEKVYDVLRQRLQQSGIELPDSDVRELARQITTGDA